MTIFVKNGQNREKPHLRRPFAQYASKVGNTHESNLILAFRIDWRCPFVARIRRSRDIGSRNENRRFPQWDTESVWRHKNSATGVFMGVESDSTTPGARKLRLYIIFGGPETNDFQVP